MAKKITFSELARFAKVSPATVSRVAAGNPKVDPKIRDRVRRAAEQHGVDLEERRFDKSRLIVFLLANRDILHRFQSRVLAGAESYASALEWELVFLSFRYDAHVPAAELHLPQILSRRSPARGVILGGVNFANLLQALANRQVPFSVLGNNVMGEWCPETSEVVYSDDIRGSYDATQHLLSQGHRHIWFIGDMRFPWFTRCGEGYRQAMGEAGREARQSEIHSDGRELGYFGGQVHSDQRRSSQRYLRRIRLCRWRRIYGAAGIGSFHSGRHQRGRI